MRDLLLTNLRLSGLDDSRRKGGLEAWRNTLDPRLVTLFVRADGESASVVLSQQEAMRLSLGLLDLYLDVPPGAEGDL